MSSSGIIEGQLSAYSCGGSRGFRTFVFHRVPVLRPAECAGTDDGRNYSLEFRRRKPDPPRKGVSVDKTGAQVL